MNKFIFLLVAILFFASANAFDKLSLSSSEKANMKNDELDPLRWERTLKLRKILKEMENTTPGDYNVKVTVIIPKNPNPGSMVMFKADPRYVYDIKLPGWGDELKELYNERTLFSRKSRFIYGEFKKLIDDPRYSFYIALFMPTINKRNLGCNPEELKPLVDMNKVEWDKDIPKYTKPIKKMEGFDIGGYITDSIRQSFAEAINGKTRSFIGLTNDSVYEGVTAGMKDIYEYMKKDYSHLADIRKINTMIEEYQKEGKSDFSTVECNAKNMRLWLHFIFAVKPEHEISNLKAFIAYLDAQKEFQDTFADLVLGLLIAKGYTFDEATGNYNLNEFGKVALDYVIAHPCELTAPKVRILIKSNNAELVSVLMSKLGTTEKWNSLLK